ncbi:hypothetical protein BBW65_07515 [Helicobacter enhydrae]|uniref:Shikimate kinase n=1 Tax=Helicobacter enhydrae TaxID=222136 RepID=A0A1B1U783_9HELI|nr:shikimate kinase [Helicobacter enhydrae]ANV98654.1 hypothetical protein BBW65_07515 [Helicobacter enhydrae]
MHYLLIGFMGSGKSTLCNRVSEALQIPIYCLDDEIQNKIGMSIAKIFECYGEEFFRTQEAEVLRGIETLQKPHLIDCGGGTPIFHSVRTYGKVCFVQESFEVIAQRLQGDDTRPLFRDVQKAHQLFSQREMIYLESADYVLSGGNKFEKLKDWILKEERIRDPLLLE